MGRNPKLYFNSNIVNIIQGIYLCNDNIHKTLISLPFYLTRVAFSYIHGAKGIRNDYTAKVGTLKVSIQP